MQKIIDSLDAGIKAGIEAAKASSVENMAINMILDESDPQNPVFVEIENDSGESIRIGERTQKCGFTCLRITTSDIINNLKI